MFFVENYVFEDLDLVFISGLNYKHYIISCMNHINTSIRGLGKNVR